MPKRIRLSRKKGWRMPPNTVKVARPGPWGNPFKVSRDGTAAECVDLFRKMLAGYLCMGIECSAREQRDYLEHAKEHLPDLRGKDLACWCRLDKPCHADVLLEVANR